MARTTEQENSIRRRAEILDADYVPREEAPNTPGAPARRSGRGVSPAAAVTVFLALLALALAVSQGDGRDGGRRPKETPVPVREARWTGVISAGETDTPAEEALGAAVETLSGPVAAYYTRKDCPQVPGAQICAVAPDSPAAAAGLAPGDVITAVDGREVLTAEALSRELCALEGGEAVCTVFRMGETLELTVQLPESPGE